MTYHQEITHVISLQITGENIGDCAAAALTGEGFVQDRKRERRKRDGRKRKRKRDPFLVCFFASHSPEIVDYSGAQTVKGEDDDVGI